MDGVRTIILLCFIVFSGLSVSAQSVIRLLSSRPGFSIRGLSVVNDSVLWVGGTQGTVELSVDGGQKWSRRPVEDADSLDFRSVYAFDSQSAVVVSAGSPAVIFRTDDGGQHWIKVFEKEDTSYFLDGVAFWNKKKGIVYGDPVDGRFVVLLTGDGGRHWRPLSFRKRPEAVKGEASFAASGTAVFSRPSGKVWIGTGGAAARVLFSGNDGRNWHVFETPMIRGESSTGIFSLAFWNEKEGICVGGDYLHPAGRKNIAFLTRDGGKSWESPVVPVGGYRSAVIYLSPDTLIATGKGGTDFSADGGTTWKRLSQKGFYVVQKARTGKSVYFAGSGGRVGLLTAFPQN